MDVKEDKKVKKTVKKKVAKHRFIKQFKTSKKVFKVDEPCYESNKKVLNYLIKNKIIK